MGTFKPCKIFITNMRAVSIVTFMACPGVIDIYVA